MFLAEPPTTAYDLRFNVWGIPVRVSIFFWVAAVLLGWDLASGIDLLMQRAADNAERMQQVPGGAELVEIAQSNPGQGILLLIWIVGMFVSILVHELGHALAMRRYGTRARIVLYHFGGLAIPESSSSFLGSTGYRRPEQQIVISAAGPAAQFALAGLMVLSLKLTGTALLWEIPFLEYAVSVTDGQQLQSMSLQALVYFFLIPSVLWPLLNLLPVYPLDGGQIAREVFTLFNPRAGIQYSLMLSVAAGAAVAIYAFMNGDLFLAMLFGLLAFSSYQILQAYSGRGGGGFGGPW